jgi:hypothetical protein
MLSCFDRSIRPRTWILRYILSHSAVVCLSLIVGSSYLDRYLDSRLLSLLEAACNRISGNSYSLVLFNSFGMRLIGAFVSKRHKKGCVLEAKFNYLRLDVRLSRSKASRLRSGDDSFDALLSDPRLSKL